MKEKKFKINEAGYAKTKDDKLHSYSAKKKINESLKKLNKDTPTLFDDLDKIATLFKQSTRVWEKVVVPAMIAFIILALYGFYLVFSVTNNVDKMTRNINQMNVSMQSMSHDMNNLDYMLHNLSSISNKMLSANNKMKKMQKQINVMQKNIQSMQKSVAIMANSNFHMRRSFGNMSQSINRPMSKFNSLIP
jgi:uncharacterized protein YoxC